MKKFFVIIIVLAIFFFGISKLCNPSKQSNPTNNVANEKVLQIIKAEPKVLDAIITDANVLYVSVKDDGTSRDGYASYLCEVLREKNSKVDQVKVVKVNSQKDPDRDNAYGVLLGKCFCK
jgi:hypothetical protein